MIKKLGIRSLLMTAFTTGLMVNSIAYGVNEAEPNDKPASAQALVIGSDGTAEVTGVIGRVSGSPVHDADFYSFEGKANDVVTIDIDGGMLDADCVMGLDSTLTLLSPNGTVVTKNADNFALDDGSLCGFDARIDNVSLPSDGTYYIAVTGYPDDVLDGNTIVLGPLGANSDGAYRLLVSRAKSATYMGIEIRPGSAEVTPLNPKAKGTLPVALLSSSTFNALAVDLNSIRFGATGKEDSLVRCNRQGADVNGDGLADLVCHFDNEKANFQLGHVQGFISGTSGGKPFEGQGYLKVVAGKRRHR